MAIMKNESSISNATYQLTLSADGRHSVTVTSDNPVAVQEGLAWARGILLKLAPQREAVTRPSEGDEEPPICGVHEIPMVRVQSRRGPFWSCHEKNPDGSWCSYKPPKT